ncbi:SRPBCC family protein [Knoellia subterranea]|uniref:Cyclase n=1 Tax=Knoellia subterranea KCTC 19937 TaxID=1385521 RepID=A0A0A0JDR0_9MICO|nr:SRPBCC family protein [Knoellia subterranea]KGN35490.1 cyclase [Knoellia subterranea KCTC 19937]
MEQSIEIDIDATPERVWEVMSDVERWPEWTETVTAVTRLDSDGALGLGARARVEQPKLPPTEYVVSEFDPGRAFTWLATGPGVRTTARHMITARPEGGAHVRLSVEQAGPLGAVMGRLFFKGLTDRYLATEAAGLKARSEGTR